MFHKKSSFITRTILLSLALVVLFVNAATLHADSELEFDDFPLEDLIEYPPWFKKSFMDLQEDLHEATENNKKGIIVYFGQKRCAYCKMLMDINFKSADIVAYTQQNFDVIPIDIWSPEELTDPHGKSTSQREYALKLNTNFTPSLVFYDPEGNIALRLRGYYAPYQFRAALEYVADGHYKREKFAVYMARGDSTLKFEAEDLVEEDFFSPPPYNMDRSKIAAERPLVVFFEQGNCHACDILHTQPLKKRAIHQRFNQFDNIQLNMWSDDPIITPEGKATTAKKWAEELGIFYAPSLIFFDENGKEIIRVDSVVHFFRLRNVLNYILTKGYMTYPNFQKWLASSGM